MRPTLLSQKTDRIPLVVNGIIPDELETLNRIHELLETDGRVNSGFIDKLSEYSWFHDDINDIEQSLLWIFRQLLEIDEATNSALVKSLSEYSWMADDLNYSESLVRHSFYYLLDNAEESTRAGLVKKLASYPWIADGITVLEGSVLGKIIRISEINSKGAAADMYFDGASYRRTAENMREYFGRDTDPTVVYKWVRALSKRADTVLRSMKADTGGVWVADEVAVKVGGKNYWLFNVMDSDTRFLLLAYLSPTRTTRATATALAMARQRSNIPPRQLKTDGLASYRDAVPRAFPTHPVKPVVSKGIRAEINNNFSERLQGTIRDRDKTLRGLKAQGTGQGYVDGLVTHYNYFRPYASLDGKRPAEAAGAELPFDSWEDVTAMKSG